MAKKDSAKKKGEFERMGDLDKGVGKKEEGTEDIIEDIIGEIESFDATKTERPEEVGEEKKGEAKAAGKTKVKTKETGETGDLRKELKREKEKTKNLAKIIEKFSSVADQPEEKPGKKSEENADVGPKLKELENKINEQVQSQLKDVKDAIVAMGTKVEEVAKSEKPEKTGTKIKDMLDKIQADTGKKITEIEETMRRMMEKVETSRKEEDVSKGLAAFGGTVDLKNEILGIKSSLKDLEMDLKELRDETDTRMTKIKEQIKVLEKIPAIEEKLEGFTESMSPGNIEKLKKFVFSADEITGEIIPNEIEKKVTKEFTPVFNDMKDMRDDIEKLTENIKGIFNEINFFKGEIKNLYKLGDYISELQKEKEKMHAEMDEKEDNLIKMVNKLEGLLKKRTDLLHDKIGEFDKIFTGKLEGKVKECFDDLSESKFLELEDRTEKHLAVSRAKVNDMFSKFIQFQNVVNPTLSLMKEELEKLNAKIEKLKAGQADMEGDIEEKLKGMFSDIAEPRIRKTEEGAVKFSEKVGGRLDDFESEFVQFQNVINPTLSLLKNDLLKLDSRIEKLKARGDDLKGEINELGSLRKAIDSIRDVMKAFEMRQKEMDKRILILGSRFAETKEEFDNVVKQTLTDRKKLEDESKKQRERINILLKELRSG